MTGLNIQTGNMCQFLPQDVVKNFPLMSGQERFLNTVRAVGEGRLVDQFDKLKVSPAGRTVSCFILLLCFRIFKRPFARTPA